MKCKLILLKRAIQVSNYTGLMTCAQLSIFSEKVFSYLAFQPFYLMRTWWLLFKKWVMRTTLDIYVFITITG